MHLCVSLCKESPYNHAEGRIHEVPYRLAGKTVDDEVRTRDDVASCGDALSTMVMLNVGTLDVCVVFMVISRLHLRNLLAHVVMVLDALAHEND